MILGMFFRLFLAVLVLFPLAPSLQSQSSSGVTIDSDLRLFTTMAALNAAGFDVELGPQYHPVREAIRKFSEGVDPDLITRLKDYYARHKAGESDEAQLAKYISLAVTLTDPPAFSLPRREELTPPDARTILDFADLLREFYQKARISLRWSELRPQYVEAMNALAPNLRDLLVKTDAYLRMPLGTTYTRTLAIYLELAAPLNSVNVRSYQDNYYVVLGGGSAPKFDDVRHGYLHFHLDNLVATNSFRVENRDSLLKLLGNAEGVDPAYTSNFNIMATESLIRVIELRMDKVPAERAAKTVEGLYRSGLLLAPYFHDSLMAYEDKGAAFRTGFNTMMSQINVKNEQARFAVTFNRIPPPEKAEAKAEVPKPAPASAPNPMRDLLKQAEAAFNSGDGAKAKAAFGKVLSEFDPNSGPAFYGLGLIASREGDGDEAKVNFERTIESPTAEPSMKVWAHIFLGRILDLDCDREGAIVHYQQASVIGDNTREAQQAALEGLKNPYGGGCSP